MEKTSEKITISREEHEKLLALVKQQEAEIDALEYRVKTLLNK